MRVFPFGLTSLVLFIFFGQLGCAVPQPPGKGRCYHLIEPETSTGYWLYLPEDYTATSGQHPDHRRWPVILTLHGLKPYDNAGPQIRTWQQEADRYRMIVIAPELRTCDSLTMQYPLKDPNLPYVRADERAVLAIMDEVFRRTNADPARVLATGFSSGGYMAHFLVNRYPERFCCLAIQGGNFSDEMLNAAQVPKYRDMKIALFFGQNDFKDCREQSMRAFDWYRRYRFDIEAKRVVGLGHERRPQTVAAFFASVIGVPPKTPPELGTLVLEDVVPRRHYQPAPRSPVGHKNATSQSPAQSDASEYRGQVGAGADMLFDLPPGAEDTMVSDDPVPAVAPVSPPARTPTLIKSRPMRGPTPKRPALQ